MSENRPLNESSRTATEKSENRDRPQIRHRVRRAPPAPTHSSADEPTSSQPIEQPSAYAVGYGRPPKHTRFKPGTSGNPRGRPKSAQGLNTLARKVMTLVEDDEPELRASEPRPAKRRSLASKRCCSRRLIWRSREILARNRRCSLSTPRQCQKCLSMMLQREPKSSPQPIWPHCRSLRRSCSTKSQSSDWAEHPPPKRSKADPLPAVPDESV